MEKMDNSYFALRIGYKKEGILLEWAVHDWQHIWIFGNKKSVYEALVALTHL